MSGGDPSWSAGELADSIRDGEIDSNIAAVMSDDGDLSDLLLYMEDIMSAPEESDTYQSIAQKAQTETLRNARMTGDTSTMSAATGISSSRIDATGYSKIVEACSPAAHQILIKGAKGTGKTTKALDIIQRLYQDGVIDRVLTNVEGPEEHEAVEFAEDISDFLEFARDPGEKIALFDEFSTSGNAYTGQQDVEQVMSRCINAFRKSSGGSLRTMYIGHENDSDIHPIVRKQSDVVLEADGKVTDGLIDCATIYSGWGDYKSDDPWFSVRGLQDVPESSDWSFDTNYFAHLEWDLDAPEKQIQRGQLIDGWDQFQDDESESDSDGESERVKCRGVNTEGEGCGSITTHKSGYCQYHRDQWGDDDPDPRRAS